MAVALLLVGYAVAVPLVVRLRGILRRRRLGALVLLEGATALVAAGWALLGAPVGVALNVAFIVAFAAAWWWTGRPDAGDPYRPGFGARSSKRPAGRKER